MIRSGRRLESSSGLFPKVGGVMFGVLRVRVLVLPVLLGLVLCLSSSGVSAPVAYASAGCAHPMVLEFNIADRTAWAMSPLLSKKDWESNAFT